jgi:dethiobiotin synthase
LSLPRGLFVTGTDTNVGKTVLAAALMLRCRTNMPVRYWKPIQTGIDQTDDQGDDTQTVERLGRCAPGELFRSGIRLPRPVSPHLAARWSGTTIEIPPLVESIAREPDDRAWIVEGAGGVLVPIGDEQTMVDLMIALDLPAIVAARTALGTINHTLLTLEALRRRNVRVAGVVMVGDPDPDNKAAIEHHGHVAVLGEMPRFTPLTAAALEAWSLSSLDPEGRLFEHLR